MKIKSYTIVTAKSEQPLMKEVNRLMADGWLPSGGPFVISQEALTVSPAELGQAMVLPDDCAPAVPVADSPLNERP